MINLILQNNSQAQSYLSMAQNSKLFTNAYKEIFDTTANYQEAIALADKILVTNTGNIQLRKMKAYYLSQLNRKEEAIKEYSKVLLTQPSDIDAKKILYNLLSTTNKQEKDVMKLLYPYDKTGYEQAYAELSSMLLESNDIQGAKLFAEKLVVMLNSLVDIVLRLLYRNSFGNELADFFASEYNALLLIWLFLRHNLSDCHCVQSPFVLHFSHTNGLCVGRSRLCHLDFFQYIFLIIVIEIRQLNGRAHFDTALVHQIQQFGDKVR